jgi:hypothetical protein
VALAETLARWTQKGDTIIKQIAMIFALVLVVTAAITVVSYVAHPPPPGCSARC